MYSHNLHSRVVTSRRSPINMPPTEDQHGMFASSRPRPCAVPQEQKALSPVGSHMPPEQARSSRPSSVSPQPLFRTIRAWPGDSSRAPSTVSQNVPRQQTIYREPQASNSASDHHQPLRSHPPDVLEPPIRPDMQASRPLYGSVAVKRKEVRQSTTPDAHHSGNSKDAANLSLIFATQAQFTHPAKPRDLTPSHHTEYPAFNDYGHTADVTISKHPAQALRGARDASFSPPQLRSRPPYAQMYNRGESLHQTQGIHRTAVATAIECSELPTSVTQASVSAPEINSLEPVARPDVNLQMRRIPEFRPLRLHLPMKRPLWQDNEIAAIASRVETPTERSLEDEMRWLGRHIKEM
jgi:hypothetical protein